MGRFILLACTLLLIVSANLVLAGEVLHGEVLSIDPGSLQLSLQPARDEQAQVVTVILSPQVRVASGAGKKRPIQKLAVGEHIKVYGAEQAQTEFFLAQRIKICTRTCNDPTGVRTRLYRQRGPKGRKGM